MDTITLNLTATELNFIIILLRDEVAKAIAFSEKHSMPQNMNDELLAGANKYRKLADNFQLHLDMYKVNREVM